MFGMITIWESEYNNLKSAVVERDQYIDMCLAVMIDQENKIRDLEYRLNLATGKTKRYPVAGRVSAVSLPGMGQFLPNGDHDMSFDSDGLPVFSRKMTPVKTEKTNDKTQETKESKNTPNDASKSDTGSISVSPTLTNDQAESVTRIVKYLEDNGYKLTPEILTWLNDKMPEWAKKTRVADSEYAKRAIDKFKLTK